MKKNLSQLVFVVGILMIFQSTVNAQVNWGSFPTVLQQLTTDERNSYNRNLDRLNRDFDPRSLDLSIPINNLNNGIQQGNPAEGISGFPGQWQGAGDELQRALQGTNLNNTDKNVALDAFEHLRITWQGTHTDLRNLYNRRPDDVYVTPQLPNRINQPSYVLWSSSQNVLQRDLARNAQNEPARGLGNFRALFRELTNPRFFKDIEFWGGIQHANVQYYNTRYSKAVPVIGISSVEQFTHLWEARWKGFVSFDGSGTHGSVFSDEVNYDNSNIRRSSFNPLFYYAEFSMMYNPALKASSYKHRAVHIISLLGIDVGTYAPAHRTRQNPHNKGNATGCGPKLGAGFSIKKGYLTSYALGALSYGEVICPGMTNDSYTSRVLEAGVRYLNKFTIRYEMRDTDWTDGLKNRIKKGVSHQITMGMPITQLLKHF